MQTWDLLTSGATNALGISGSQYVATSVSLSPTVALPVGTLVVVIGTELDDPSVGPPTVADSQNNTWNQITTGLITGASDLQPCEAYWVAWYTILTAALATADTITVSGTGDMAMEFAAWDSAQTTGTVQANFVNFVTGEASGNTINLTTGSLFVGVGLGVSVPQFGVDQYGNVISENAATLGAFTPGSGWTTVLSETNFSTNNGNDNWTQGIGYLVSGAAVTFDPTINNTNGMNTLLLAFNPGPAPASQPSLTTLQIELEGSQPTGGASGGTYSTASYTAEEIPNVLVTPEIVTVNMDTGSPDLTTETSSGAPLPFLFAWVDSDETEFTQAMMRVDEQVLDIELKHDEGQIPTLSVTIKNPYKGLLNSTRKQWAWLAYQPPLLDPYFDGVYAGPGDFTNVPNGYGSSGATDNAPTASEGIPEYVVDGYVLPGYQVYDGATQVLTPPTPSQPNLGVSPVPSPGSIGIPPYTNGNTVVPIFFGELIGIPDDLFAEKITLKFLARSMNYFEWKQAVAETLKIPGNYDPVFLTDKERDNPDAVLEGWSSMYHVDRTTLEVTASDVLVGEEGTIVFPASPPTALYKSLKVKIGQAPLTNVQVQAQVHWTQRTLGYVDGPDVNLSSYTGGTFFTEWSKLPGRNLGAGWTVDSAYVNDPFMVEHTQNWHITTDTQFYGTLVDYDCAVVSINESQSGPALLGSAIMGQIITTGQDGLCNPYTNPPVNLPTKLVAKRLYIPLWQLNCSWTLQYKAKREFTETIFVDVTANAQNILTSPTVEQDTALIKLNGEVGQPVMIYEAWTDYENATVQQGQLIYPNDPTTPGGLSYQVAINSGTTGTTEPVFSDVPGTITQDNEVQWASLGETPQNSIQQMSYATSYNIGTILNYTEQVFDSNQGALVPTLNSQYYLVVQECATTNVPTQITYQPPITESDELLFPVAKRTIFVDQFYPVGGMVPLTESASFLGIPAGGTADNVTARCYFPTDRGQQSVKYAINRARAKIRMRSRAVEVSWDCPIEMVLGMSCRMNATIYDPRLPGGVATGKVLSYGMTAKDGKIRGHVTIGCSVGYNAFGSPNADISYTAPVFEPFDDGLQFPLSYCPCDGGSFTMTLDEQVTALGPGITAELTAMAIQNPPEPTTPVQVGTGGVTSVTTGVSAGASWTAAEDAAVLPALMQGNPIAWVAEIDPVTNGPFLGAYTIDVTPLELPQGINLTAGAEND